MSELRSDGQDSWLPGSLSYGGDHEAGNSRQACVADLLEAGFAEPGGIFRLAVTGAAAGTDQHVEGEQRGEAGGRFVGLQDEILNDDAAAGSQRLAAAAQQVDILRGAEHVTDGGDEDQVVAFAETAGTQIAGADVDAVRYPGVLDVAPGDGLDGGEVQDVGPQGRVGAGESDGIGARSAAHVQHAADGLPTRAADGRRWP